MNLRETQEERECKILSKYGSKSKFTKGREIPTEKCDIRTEYQRDRDKILHCKSFRRLKQKTQVFISPEGDHYRTRLTHTLEVAQIARTISRALGLNEDLTEAIALGHDLGHTPFGHSGEKALNEICENGFDHSKQSLRVVDVLENDGKGLNLTFEVRDGILNHRTKGTPKTLEGKVVRISDKIAYVNHDLEDAERANLLKPSDIPKDILELFGETKSERLNTILNDLIRESLDKPEIKMSDEFSEKFTGLRTFMFKNVYHDARFNKELTKVSHIITGLYEYYSDNFEKLPPEYIKLSKKGETKQNIICDYIAGMTDRYAIKQYTDIFIPSRFDVY